MIISPFFLVWNDWAHHNTWWIDDCANSIGTCACENLGEFNRFAYLNEIGCVTFFDEIQEYAHI